MINGKAEAEKRPFRKLVFIQLLLSFLLIMLIPLAIGGVLYTRMEQALIVNANQSNQALLEQVRLSIDSRMHEIEQVAAQVGMNPHLQMLLYGEEQKDDFDQYKYVELIRSFRQYRSVSSMIDDYYIYLKESGHVLTTSIKTNSQMFYEHIHDYNRRDTDNMKALLSQYHLKTYLPVEPIQYSLKERNMITYIKSLPMGEENDVRGALVIMLDEEKILSLVRQADSRNADFYILNDRMQMLATTANKPDAGLLQDIIPRIDAVQGDFETVVGGSDMMVSYTSSSPNQWTYVSVLPKKVVLSKVNETKKLAFYLVLLCLAAGTAVSYYLAYKNHRPIRELVHVIMTGKNLQDTKIRNELAFIREEVITSLDEEKSMRGLLSQQAPVIQSDFIARLIKGYVDTKQLTKSDFDFMGIHFKHGRFGVVIIQIDDCWRFIQEDTEREWTLIRFIIINLSNELLQSRGYAIEMERDRVCILLNHAEPQDQIREEMQRLLEQLKNQVELKFHTTITIAISGLKHGMDTIADAYGEAVMALEHRMIRGQSSIIDYKEIKNAGHHYFYYPLETEAQLVNYAKSGDYNSIAKLIDHVFEVNFRTRAISPEMGKCLFFELLNTVLKLFNTQQMDERTFFGEDIDPIRYMARLGTADKMNEKLKELYAAICKKVEGERTDHSDRLYQKILHYIELNYASHDISLTSVADYAGLNSSYLSSFFKKQSGQNLTDFIAALRVKQAKLYLETGGLTVSQIAVKVGFANDVGLIRVFKKSEGITPGKYRELILSQVDQDMAGA